MWYRESRPASEVIKYLLKRKCLQAFLAQHQAEQGIPKETDKIHILFPSLCTCPIRHFKAFFLSLAISRSLPSHSCLEDFSSSLSKHMVNGCIPRRVASVLSWTQHPRKRAHLLAARSFNNPLLHPLTSVRQSHRSVSWRSFVPGLLLFLSELSLGHVKNMCHVKNYR